MRITEKTCPNCGASIDFNKGDEKVKCEYCKKTYVVEWDKEDNFDLVEKQFNKFFIIIFVFAFAMIFLVGFFIMTGVFQTNKFISDLESGINSTKEIKSFDDISSETISAVHKTSVEVLNSNSNVTSYIYEQKEPFTNVGMYLFIFDSGSTLYDVYVAKYDIKGTVKDVYTAIQFEDVNKNAKNLYGVHVVNTNIGSEMFMVGFESDKELYDNVAKKVAFKNVYSTGDLYLEK